MNKENMDLLEQVISLKSEVASTRDQLITRLGDIASLELENEQLRKQIDVVTESLIAATNKIDALERLRKDAERYQKLRKYREVLLLTGFFGNGCVNRTLEEVDAELDAMKETK